MKKPLRLIVCVNKRPGTDQCSCVGSGSLGLTRRIGTMITGEVLGVPVVQRECLRRRES